MWLWDTLLAAVHAVAALLSRELASAPTCSNIAGIYLVTTVPGAVYVEIIQSGCVATAQLPALFGDSAGVWSGPVASDNFNASSAKDHSWTLMHYNQTAGELSWPDGRMVRQPCVKLGRIYQERGEGTGLIGQWYVVSQKGCNATFRGAVASFDVAVDGKTVTWLRGQRTGISQGTYSLTSGAIQWQEDSPWLPNGIVPCFSESDYAPSEACYNLLLPLQMDGTFDALRTWASSNGGLEALRGHGCIGPSEKDLDSCPFDCVFDQYGCHCDYERSCVSNGFAWVSTAWPCEEKDLLLSTRIRPATRACCSSKMSFCDVEGTVTFPAPSPLPTPLPLPTTPAPGGSDTNASDTNCAMVDDSRIRRAEMLTGLKAMNCST